MTENIKAVCFGEILWDIFPDAKYIGGAPLNVASRLSSFGIDTEIISKVGLDENGDYLISYLRSKNVKTSNILRDEKYPTGIVNVSLSRGSASYDIIYPSAWDRILLTNNMTESIKDASAFIFGSLVCRNEESASTLFSLLDYASFKVLDVNLRKPYYSMRTLLKLMEKADFIKFNEEELYEICNKIDIGGKSIADKIKKISEKTAVSHICVTRGAQGVILYYRGEFFHNTGFKIKIKDTVGAGDSFLAAYISQILLKKHPHTALDYACAVGSIVASKEGANADISQLEIRKLMWCD